MKCSRDHWKRFGHILLFLLAIFTYSFIERKCIVNMDKKKKKMYAATLVLAFTGYVSPIIGWIDALGGNVIVPVTINVAVAAIVGSILIRMIEDL